MAVEQIKETDTLNQGRVKINAVLDQSNASSEKVDAYKTELTEGVKQAKEIAENAGNQAKEIAEEAGENANKKADQAIADSKTAVDTSNRAIGTANQNKQDFDALRNEFEGVVAESGDSTPEIVQARTDTQGIKQTTLQARLIKDFGDRLTSADAVQMFSGPINTSKTMDFSGKTAGNKFSNPHVAYADNSSTSLKTPTASWTEMNQEEYNKVAGRDDTGVSTESMRNGIVPQQRYEFDILETVKQLAPNIFDGLDIGESVKFVKENFISFSLNTRSKASSSGNKVLKVATYLESANTYTTQIQQNAADYTDFKIDINDSNFISSEGKLNVLVYTDSANGVTASIVDTDYIGTQLTISLNPLTVLETSGFVKKSYVESEVSNLATKTELDEHTENVDNPHNVSKSQIGLGLVENYSVATQEEAEIGEVSNKYMTPVRVFQAISEWVKGKFVGKVGDEDVGGVKNFTSIPQINNIPIAVDRGVAYKEITLNKSTNANIKSGFIRLWRVGNLVNVGVYLSLSGPVRWANLSSIPKGFVPQSPGSLGVPLGSNGGEQLAATLYAGSGNFKLLTAATLPASGYDFQGMGIYYTESDFPS